jgi:hypothetical protein
MAEYQRPSDLEDGGRGKFLRLIERVDGACIEIGHLHRLVPVKFGSALCYHGEVAWLNAI